MLEIIYFIVSECSGGAFKSIASEISNLDDMLTQSDLSARATFDFIVRKKSSIFCIKINV